MLAALVLFNGAYLAEIVRAGIASVPRAQVEGARALGLTRGQALRLVILPQAGRSMLPSLVQQLVTTLKETSLGYVIGLPELSFIAGQVNAQTITHSTGIYVALALVYFLLCFGLSSMGRALERHLARPARAAAAS